MQVEGSGAEPRVGSSFDTNHATMPGFGGGSFEGSIADPERNDPSHIEISDGGDAAAASERAAKGGEFVAEAASAGEERLLLRRVVEANIRMQETLTRLVEARENADLAEKNRYLAARCRDLEHRLTDAMHEIAKREECFKSANKRIAELEVRNADLEKRVKAWADKDAARIEKKRVTNNRWYHNSKTRKAKNNG